MKFIPALLILFQLNLLQAAENDFTRACSTSQGPGQNAELAQAILEVNAAKFSTPEKRKANKDAYLAAIKKAIAATSSGSHLLSCLDNSKDPRFEAKGEFFLDETLDGLIASFENRKNPSGKYVRRVTLLAAENPMAAISFLAHEMEHACNASEFLNSESQSDMVFDQLKLVNEIRAYKLQSEFFLEIARQSPSLVCETSPSESKLFPGQSFTLQDLMAKVGETLKNGTFPGILIDSYLKLELFGSASHFFDEGRVPREDLVSRFESADLKIAAP